MYNRTVDKEDRSLISDMISDCEFVEQWLETGRMPGSRRGIDRRSVYQRTKVWNPSWMEQLITKPAGPDRELTEDERMPVRDAAPPSSNSVFSPSLLAAAPNIRSRVFVCLQMILHAMECLPVLRRHPEVNHAYRSQLAAALRHPSQPNSTFL
ncbi:hypothetical protein ACJ7K1_17455 [Paenibacillus elgii]